MKINLNAPINKTSYGYVSFNILKQLVKQGHDVALFPIGPLEIDKQEDAIIIKECIEKSKTTFDSNSPCLRIYHQNKMAESIGNGKRYGMPIFELDTFTDEERHHLSSQLPMG